MDSLEKFQGGKSKKWDETESNKMTKKLIFSQLVLHESLQILNFDPWKVIARKSVDWHKDAQIPNISMMVFVNAKTHVYTLNVLHRTYQEGQIKDIAHLDITIQRFFDQTSPCYGFSQSSEVPYQFAQDCKVLVRGDETICDQCRDQIIFVKEDHEELPIFDEDPKEEEGSVDVDLVEAVLEDDSDINKLFPSLISRKIDEIKIMDLAERVQIKKEEERWEVETVDPDPDAASIGENIESLGKSEEDGPSVPNQRSSRKCRKSLVKRHSIVFENDDKEGQSQIKTKPKKENEEHDDDEFVPDLDHSDSEVEEDPDNRKNWTRKYLPRGYQIKPLSESDPRIPCPFCTSLFKSANALKSHLRFHRSIKPPKKPSKRPKLVCSHCDAIYQQPKALAKHLKEKHGASEEAIEKLQVKTQCWICLKMCKNLSALEIHKKKEHLLGKWQCLLCEEKPRHGKEVMEHYESKHGQSIFAIYCVICSTKLCFSDGYHILEDHWKLCYQKRKQQQVLNFRKKRQNISTEITKKHMCDQCGMSFPLKSVLQEHQNEHKGIFKYQCPDCDYKSAFRKKFLYHRRHRHTNGPKTVIDYVSCEYCGKIVNSKAMSDHINRCHSDPTFLCKHCNKLFCTRGLLNGHIKAVHSKKIPVQCKVCGMFLKSKNNVRGHMLTHAPPKFTCRFCGKGLKTRLSWGNHERIHTKENPYKCDQCSFACATSGNLLLHKKRNHGLQKKLFYTPVQIPAGEEEPNP